MIYVAPSAVVVGDVTIEDGASVWHGAVLRGDFDGIIVGRDSNVQDHVVVHVDRGMPARIGARVTIGHSAVVPGCTIGDEIGSGSLVASGAVVRESAEFPSGALIGGLPAKAIRAVDETLRRRISLSWSIYRDLATASLPPKRAVRGDSSKQVVLAPSEEFTRLIQRE